jgi:hypothetical protein
MKVTPTQYYKGFWDLKSILASVSFIFPLLGACAPDSNAFIEYLYPPLGDIQRLALSITSGFLILITYLVFSISPLARKVRLRVIMIVLAVFLLFGSLLMVVAERFVKRVQIGEHQETLLSIGYQRSDFAIRNYAQSSDEEMLSERPLEDQIQKLWTRRSINFVRVLLWLSYTLTLGCFLFGASLFAYQRAAEESSG